jgi:hypothetical protein
MSLISSSFYFCSYLVISTPSIPLLSAGEEVSVVLILLTLRMESKSLLFLIFFVNLLDFNSAEYSKF